jgi:SAM-dependent methyltransferase/glycosyltransferase involved in cell wall biosynthesis
MIHLVYPHGSAVACPDAIGRHVGSLLAERYPVRLYDWNDVSRIEPERGDVLIGHPHPALGTIFRRSMRSAGWRRVIAMCPFNHDPSQVGFLDSILRQCDQYLALTGSYWFQAIGKSYFSHWLPKMVQVDLAVDRNEFPFIKRKFATPGRRRFLYIGHSGHVKNVGYLSQIARLLPNRDFAWIGKGDAIPGVRSLGAQDFSQDSARELAAAYDFMVTVGRADANPATVLEAMAWGLVPVCTPQSGYVGLPGVKTVPLDDAAGAARVLQELQQTPGDHLQRLQSHNQELLQSHFTWDRLVGQIVHAIEDDSAFEDAAEPVKRRARLTLAATTSRHSPLRLAHLKLTAASLTTHVRSCETRLADENNSAGTRPSVDEVMTTLRSNPANSKFLRDAYLDEDVVGAAKRFDRSAEFCEVTRLLGSRIKGRILDLGAGTGIASYAFARRGAAHVYALEPSGSELVGRGAISRLMDGLPIEVIAAYGEDIPLTDESVDVVYARQVLHHADDLCSLVEECGRVLRKGGMFLACREHVVNDEKQLGTFLSTHPLHALLNNESAFSVQTYLAAIDAAGLQVVRMLGPCDTVINSYPSTRTCEEFEDMIAGKLQRRLGRAGAIPLRIPGIEARLRAWLNHRGAGRMYTFVAEKSS